MLVLSFLDPVTLLSFPASFHLIPHPPSNTSPLPNHLPPSLSLPHTQLKTQPAPLSHCVHCATRDRG